MRLFKTTSDTLTKSPSVMFKRGTLSTLLIVAISSGLAGCGGSDTDKIKEEYDRIEDQVKAEYDRVEARLTDNEKSMYEIIESVFLPENFDEDLEDFLDKLTPEGGRGGLYAGHFVELNDGDDNDVDVGAVYFDISKDAAGSVDGRVSYQQARCQDNNTLATDTAIKVDNYLTGKLSGSLDTPEFLDIKYINKLGIETPNILTTFAGEFNEALNGNPWVGSFEYQDGLGGNELSSGKEGCDVTYTLSDRANYAAYPLDYKLGNLSTMVVGNGSQARLIWNNPTEAKLTLVSQINVNKAESGANGYEVNELFTADELTEGASFTPKMTDTPTNYAFVVQAFDDNNDLIAYESVIMDLPESLN